MKGQKRPQVDIAEVIGVDDHNLIGLVRQIGVGRNGTSRAQKRRLVRLDEAQPAFGIDPRNVGTNLIGLGVRVDPSLADSRVGQVIDPEVQQGTIRDAAPGIWGSCR